MTFGPLSRRPGVRVLCALLALVAVLWLNAAPHRHSDDWSERHCAACQVVRGNGQAAPERTVTLTPPGAVEMRVESLLPAPVVTVRHDGPLPGRSPPLALS